MSFLSNPPTLTLLGQEGCETCARSKEEMNSIVRPKLAPLGFRLAYVDLSVETVDVPVVATPAFHLSLNGKNYYTDAKDLAQKAGLPPSGDAILQWVNAMIGRQKRGRS